MNYYKHCNAVENQTLSFLKAKACSLKKHSNILQYGEVCGTAVPRSLYIWSFRYTVYQRLNKKYMILAVLGNRI